MWPGSRPCAWSTAWPHWDRFIPDGRICMRSQRQPRYRMRVRSFLVDTVRLGYRAAYVYTLASEIESGAFDIAELDALEAQRHRGRAGRGLYAGERDRQNHGQLPHLPGPVTTTASPSTAPSSITAPNTISTAANPRPRKWRRCSSPTENGKRWSGGSRDGSITSNATRQANPNRI